MSRPAHGKKKKTNIVFKISSVIFLLCICVLAYLFWTYYSGQKEYDDLKQYCDIEGKTLADVKIDWESLREINSDVVGWIYMPDTVISYPIVWKENDDAYYLKHNFNNRSTQFGAEYGCIFLSGSNKRDFSDNTNFIFGHNMANGTVFGVFSDEQANSEWFNSHRTIYVFTPSGNYKLTTYAQNKVHSSATDIVYTSFGNTEQLRNYAQERIDNSIVDADNVKKVSDMKKLFSFSTCSSPDDNMRVLTFSDVDEYYDFNDQSNNINILEGARGSIVTNSMQEQLDDDSSARQN